MRIIVAILIAVLNVSMCFFVQQTQQLIQANLVLLCNYYKLIQGEKG